MFGTRPGTNTSSEGALLTALANLAAGGVGTAIQKTTATTFTNVTIGAGTGTVTGVIIATANGFAGTSDGNPATPTITLTTSVTGLLKGNGTTMVAATAGTDYSTASATETLTNKTFDTAGTGNVFKINGTGITAVTGTGSVVLAASPTITGHMTVEGVTATGATGTGNFVFATSPTLSGAALGSTSTATTQSPNDNSTKLATTAYVDAAVLNFDSKPQVAYASTVALPANTYNNGTSGVGATLTGNSNGPLLIDSVTILVAQAGERVLVAGEATQANNGWYVITQVGVVAVSPYILTRATESDQAAEIGSGYLTSVIAPNGVTPGTGNNGKAFLSVAAADPFVVGTTNLTFSQIGGTYTNGNGISLSGSTFSIDTTVTVDKTTVQTLTNKTLTSPVLTTPTLGVASATTINKVTITAPATGATLTIVDGKTLTVSNSLTLAGTDTTTMTFPATSDTIAGLGTAQIFTGLNTFKQINFTNNAITATSNAATVPITHRFQTVTNNSAATLTITITTTSAVNGQLLMLEVLDFSAVAQTLTFVNTENSGVTVPATTNGSTTLPLTIGFKYNSATSKWRCIAVA